MDELDVVRRLQQMSAEFRHSSFFQHLSTVLDEASEIILQKKDCPNVVRCKDCKHCGVLEHNGKRYCKKPMGCLGCTPTEPENFCSYGERKDNG